MNQTLNQKSFQNQKIIQDQNYSHNILYMILSTIQSLKLAFQNKLQSDFNHKTFAKVDVVDYRDKSIAELKSQLSMHLHLFRTSRMIFEIENPGVEWILPSNMSIQQIMAFIKNCCEAFQSDPQAIQLAAATLQILGKKLDDLYIDHHDFTVNYTEQQKQQQKKKLLNAGIFAGEEMDKRKKEVEDMGITDASQLVAPVNINDPIFATQSTTNTNPNENQTPTITEELSKESEQEQKEQIQQEQIQEEHQLQPQAELSGEGDNDIVEQLEKMEIDPQPQQNDH